MIQTTGNTIVKNRFLGFLIWQSIHTTTVYLFSKIFLFSPFTPNPLTPSISSFFSFILFHLSILLFSTCLFLVSSPQLQKAASPIELVLGLLRLVFVAGGQPSPVEFRRRVRISLGFLLFASASAFSCFLAVVALCWTQPNGVLLIGRVGLRALVSGFLYGFHYLYRRRWILEFPIIQRPPFFSFKMGITTAIGNTFRLSNVACLISTLLTIFLSSDYMGQVMMSKVFVEQMLVYIATFVVFFCWELSHHLLQVLLTKRLSFAPPKGSAAAETNPSDPLLAALEGAAPGSVLQYLAYLDLCMVSESNVDTWRRAAFFEETGETYKKVIAVCLRPLERLISNLGEGMESSLPENIQFSQKLQWTTQHSANFRLREPFYDFQLCVWCARILASLTVHSHKEDRFGVAQLSGSNADVLSTLLSGLLAAETFMGKKTNLQSSMHHLTGPSEIKWAALSTRRETTVSVAGKRKDSPHYSKAYSMADTLRTSIYLVVSNFYDELLTSSKAGLAEKDWIRTSKPLYGTQELLLQKLQLFLDFQAC